jgi:hypothetical protein
MIANEVRTMIKTIEAVIDDDGNIRLLEPVHLGSARRALVVILDEPENHVDESAVLNEAALSDWNCPEEDCSMALLAAGKVVGVAFPFSDLSQSKLRPAVVFTGAVRGDWILCQARYSSG